MKKDMLKEIIDFLPNSNEYIVSLVGLNKNSGKTETLIYILNSLYRNNINVAVTSIGFDGEKVDMIFNHAKPEFVVPKGTFIATAELVVNNIKGEHTVLEDIEEYGPLGKIYIIKANSQLTTELVGPSSIDGLRKVCKCLKKYCSKVFIDGAYNRIAQISPDLVDYSILSIGGTSLEVLKKRAEKLMLLRSIPEYNLHMLDKYFGQDLHFLVNEDLKSVSKVDQSKRNSTLIYNGALTENVAKIALEKKAKLIVSDISKIFLKETTIKKFINNNSLYVYYKDEVLLISYNPLNFSGQSYESEEFGKEISKWFSSIYCCDVISSNCYKGGSLNGYIK